MKDTPGVPRGIFPIIFSRRWRKAVIAAAVIAVCLAALTIVSFDVTRYAPKIASIIASSTGATFKAREIRLNILPRPTLAFIDAEGGKDGLVSFSARLVRVKLSVIRLVLGRPAAASVEAVGADISVKAGLPADTGGKAGFTLPVRSMTLVDSKVRLRDQRWAPFQTIIVSSAYLKEGGMGLVFGADGAFKDGPAFGLSGGLSVDMKEASVKGGIQRLDIAPFKPRLTQTCGCVLPDGVIDAAFSLSYAAPAVELSVERFSFTTQAFSVKGGLDFSGTRDLAGVFLVKAFAAKAPFKALKESLPAGLMPEALASVVKSLDPMDGEITIKELSLSGSLRRVDGRLIVKDGPVTIDASLDKLRFRYAHLMREVSELSGRMTFKADALTLSGVTGRYGNSYVKAFDAEVTDVKGRLNYGANMEMTLDAGESLEVARRFSGQGVRRRLEKLSASGWVGLKLGLKGSIRTGARPKFSGAAHIEGVKLAYAVAPLAIQSLSGEMAFDERKVELRRLSAFDGYSSFELDGTIEDYLSDAPSFELAASLNASNETLKKALAADGPLMEGDLKVTARVKSKKDAFAVYASLDTIKPKGHPAEGEGKRLFSVKGGELFLEESYGGAFTGGASGAGSGVFKAAAGSLWGHPFKDLSAALALDDEAVRIKPFSAVIDNGGASGEMVYYRKKENPLLFETSLGLRGVDLGTLISAAGAKEPVLAGGMDAEARLTSRRGSPSFSGGLNGSASISSERGRLYKFLILAKVFSIVNIVSIDELFKEGLPYKRLRGSFSVKDGIISTEDMYLDSDSMRMSAAGNIDLPSGGIDAYLALHPFVTLDKVVSSIPVAGWIIAGKEKSFISMYYGITGPLKKPDVSPAPIKNISAGILGILERLVESPPDIPAQGR